MSDKDVEEKSHYRPLWFKYKQPAFIYPMSTPTTTHYSDSNPSYPSYVPSNSRSTSYPVYSSVYSTVTSGEATKEVSMEDTPTNEGNDSEVCFITESFNPPPMNQKHNV